MMEVILVVYLLAGFQVGGRVFHWGRKISKGPMDFIVPLALVPLAWPFMFLLYPFMKSMRELFHTWDE